MSKRRFFTFIPLLLLLFVALACAQSQPSSQQQQLQATISALQTQVAARQNQPFTPTPASEQSQERQLQATIVALQTQVAQPPSGPSTVSTLSPTPLQDAVPDTVPGTILEVGQTWRQNGLEMRLQEATIGVDWGGSDTGVYITLILSNQKAHDITLRYNLGEAVSASDNRGHPLKLGTVHAAQNIYPIDDIVVVLHSGETIGLTSNIVYAGEDFSPPSLFIYADTANPAVTEIIVSISIGSIRNARWRIPIFH